MLKLKNIYILNIRHPTISKRKRLANRKGFLFFLPSLAKTERIRLVYVGVLRFLASVWAGSLPASIQLILQELRYYSCQSFVCIKAFIWKAQSKSPFSHETVLIYVLLPSPDFIDLCMALNICFLHTRRKLCKKGFCTGCLLFNNCPKASFMQKCMKLWKETEQGILPYAMNRQGGFLRN